VRRSDGFSRRAGILKDLVCEICAGVWFYRNSGDFKRVVRAELSYSRSSHMWELTSRKFRTRSH
jgi:hypothetical protein